MAIGKRNHPQFDRPAHFLDHLNPRLPVMLARAEDTPDGSEIIAECRGIVAMPALPATMKETPDGDV